MARLILETDASPDECLARIRAGTEPWPFAGLISPAPTTADPFYPDPLLASIRRSRFKLVYSSHSRTLLKGGIFFGRVVRQAGGTRIYGRVGEPLPLLVFLSSIFALPAAALLPLPAIVPAFDRYEIQFVAYMVIAAIFLRVVGAWDGGNSKDPYSSVLHRLLDGTGDAESAGG